MSRSTNVYLCGGLDKNLQCSMLVFKSDKFSFWPVYAANLRNILTLVLLTFSVFVTGQSNYFSFKTFKKGKEISFPVFSHDRDTNTTEKINQLLQISELEMIRRHETDNIFEKVVRDDGTIYGGKVEISFRIFRNSDQHLSIQFTESSCGATCAYWVRYYNFNPGNGEMFQLKDLFTQSGYETFYKVISKKRIFDFKEALSRLDSSERDGFDDIIRCYQTDKLEDFYVKDNALYIDGENCFSKNQKFFGLATISKFKLPEFQNYLNGYGKAVFSLSQDSISKFHSASLPQLFEGKIAGKDVIMVLNHGYEQEMRGEYVYIKYGTGIFLEGTLVNGILAMTEKSEDFNDAGYINAIFDGKQIIGTWTNKDKTRNYKVILKRK